MPRSDSHTVRYFSARIKGIHPFPQSRGRHLAVSYPGRGTNSPLTATTIKWTSSNNLKPAGLP